jgi:uncharacterized membrane protein HdeD (DUF308 family)
MSDQAKAMLELGKPWRRGAAWGVILVEGVVALGIGVYILAQPDEARDVVRQLIAAVLLVNGLMQVFAGFRLPQSPAAPYRILRGGVGATVGLIVTLEPVSDYLESDASRFILALGGLAYGLIGLVQVVATREETGLRIGPLIVSGLWILLAILFLTGDETDQTRMNLVGIVAVVFGLLLLAYAFYLYRLKQAGVAAQADPADPADPAAEGVAG